MEQKSKQLYIDKCRYYKGEDSNPYKEQHALCWRLESRWCAMELEQSNILNEYKTEYIHSGLLLYSANDGVPIRLKALLLVRFYAQNGSIPYGASDFKHWYEHHYLK